TCMSSSTTSFDGARPMRTTSPASSNVVPAARPWVTERWSRVASASLRARVEAVDHRLQRLVEGDLLLVLLVDRLVDDLLQRGGDAGVALGQEAVERGGGGEADGRVADL